LFPGLSGSAAPPTASVDAPFYIVEVGSGHGRMGWYMLRAIDELKKTSAVLRSMDIVYVLTDSAEANVDFYREFQVRASRLRALSSSLPLPPPPSRLPQSSPSVAVASLPRALPFFFRLAATVTAAAAAPLRP